MHDLLTQILDWQTAGERVAIATVIRVAGSAPRPVGASMIVSSGERMAGSVSGGCVETTVYEELMDILAGGAPRNLHFGITEDMIWDVGLACGGTIDVFCRELNPRLASTMEEYLSKGEAFALATVVTGKGRVGETTLITQTGTAIGSSIPAAVTTAREALSSRIAAGRVLPVTPGIEVYIEPFLPPAVLIIIGGVHTAIPLTRFAKELGFRVVVADPRAKFANRERFPEADEILIEWPDEALAHLEVDKATCIALLTHDPKIDEPALAAALKTEAAYIGAIGSRATHAARFERMAPWGVSPGQL